MNSISKSKKSPFPVLYAGPISYYVQLIKLQPEFDLHENFTKQTFRNRARIYGANGVITLSIPVQGGAQNLPVSEVQISNIEAWQRTQWRTLVSAYKSSPFFEFYIHLFEPHFSTPFNKLIDFNLAIHSTVLECLQIEMKPQFTTQFHPVQKNDPRIAYSSKKAHPVSVEFPVYQQVFSYNTPFETDLSILDALFNLGPETLNYLENLEL